MIWRWGWGRYCEGLRILGLFGLESSFVKNNLAFIARHSFVNSLLPRLDMSEERIRPIYSLRDR